jgi:hypothetical protein
MILLCFLESRRIQKKLCLQSKSTTLIRAVRSGKIDCVRVLLGARVDVDAKESLVRRYLTFAYEEYFNFIGLLHFFPSMNLLIFCLFDSVRLRLF